MRAQADDRFPILETHLPDAVMRAVAHEEKLPVRRQTARVSEDTLAVVAFDRQPQLALPVEDLDAVVVAVRDHDATIRQRHHMRRTPEADQYCEGSG